MRPEYPKRGYLAFLGREMVIEGVGLLHVTTDRVYIYDAHTQTQRRAYKVMVPDPEVPGTSTKVRVTELYKRHLERCLAMKLDPWTVTRTPTSDEVQSYFEQSKGEV